MSEFLTSVASFLAAHVILPIPSIRGRLIGLLGRRLYLVGYSVLSIVLIVWVVAAARRAPYTELWQPHSWQAAVPLAVVPVAAWLLIGGLAEPNPLSISFRSDAGAPVGAMARVTRHPALWAFLLWAASHVIANGDLISLIMFGGLVILAAGGFKLVDYRARKRLGTDRWSELAGSTSIIPFAAILSGRTRFAWNWRMSMSALIALTVSIWFVLAGHASLIGVDPLARFGA